MASFDSPLGKKKIPQSHQFREFSVPDESDNEFNVQRAINQPGMKELNLDEIRAFNERMNASFADVPQPQNASVMQEMNTAKQLKQRGKERLSEGGKKRLEMLLGMTKSNKEVSINTGDQVINFVLSTLSGKEIREALLASSVVSGIEELFEIRKQFLARSLISIGDLTIDQFVGSSDLEDKLLFIEELDDVILTRLYNEYLSLAADAKKKFGINSEAAGKEVIEDLKK